MKDLKKIRIDYFHYRVRKGTAYVLLNKAAESEVYSVPSRYVTKDERVCTDYFEEDDGDLVILNCKVNESHLGKKNKCWTPLLDVVNLSFPQERSNKDIKNCLSLFLGLCPREERILLNKVGTALDEFLTDEAKAAYRNELQGKTGGQADRIMTDTFWTSPDPALVEEEIRTLKHFRLKKLDRGRGYGQMEYCYEPIDWGALGAKRESLMNLIMPFDSGNLMEDDMQ